MRLFFVNAAVKDLYAAFSHVKQALAHADSLANFLAFNSADSASICDIAVCHALTCFCSSVMICCALKQSVE